MALGLREFLPLMRTQVQFLALTQWLAISYNPSSRASNVLF